MKRKPFLKLVLGFVVALTTSIFAAEKVNKRLASTFDELRSPSETESSGEENDGDEPALATFGNGCFWCTEAVFENLKGVHRVSSGYSGGRVKNPTYEQVCTGRTGHAEVVRIEYDPTVISFAKLLEVFWITHDPTTLNEQGPDHGTQYRSAVFYHTDAQRDLAKVYKDKLNQEKVFGKPVVTEITKYKNFYPAENYHQDYFAHNGRQPYCRMFVLPKVEKVRLLFKDDLKENTKEANSTSDTPKKEAPQVTEPKEKKKVVKSKAEWRKQLSREQFRVAREGGTERAFANRYWKNKATGIYHCVCCDEPLFDSKAKYESGTGWPSFFAPLSKDAVGTKVDRSLFGVRAEVVCDRCDAHLGHVFPDGPRPTGLRYCMNSAALKFEKASDSKE